MSGHGTWMTAFRGFGLSRDFCFIDKHLTPT